MREIKFRVWDYDTEKMQYIAGVAISKGNIISAINGEVMQYTGLRDKNGKEIWQSDFIKGHGAGFSTTHSEVHFTHDGAQIEIGDHWIQLSKFIEIEVIGHKYKKKDAKAQKK